MKLRTLLLAYSILVCTATFAQTNILQDDDGKSSLSIVTRDTSESHTLNINAVDKSIAFVLSRDNAKNDFFFGGSQFKVSGKDGKFPILKDGVANFQCDVSGSFYWLVDGTFTFFYVTGKGGVGRILTISQPAADTILTTTKTSIGRSVQIGFNRLSLMTGNGNFLANLFAGIAVESGKGDNVRRIDKLEYREIQYTGTDKDGKPTHVTKEVKEGYAKNTFKRNESFVSTLVDIGYRFNRVTTAAHLRWESYGDDGFPTLFSPGIGIYLTELHKPTKAVVGVQYFIKDIYDVQEKNTDKIERTSINMVLGFKF